MHKINYKNLFNVRNKTVLIVGGSGLVGGELSNAFAQLGSKVIIADNNLDESKKWKELIQTIFTNDEITQLYESAEFCIITRLNKITNDLENMDGIKFDYAQYLRQCINNYDMEGILNSLPDRRTSK